ncbi:MAG: DDE-type integrase/transposase/recombinase, partial [Bacillota bacterium]|nr:DDE-type integrase/transposase/recombinase [Bacillota bacterium]
MLSCHIADQFLEYTVATFRRYVHAAMPELLATSPMPIWRPEVDPGEEAQVDFGYMGPWQDPITGKTHRVYAFALVLSYSRHMFVRLVVRLNALSWQQCHTEALAFFGAVPRRIILNNLKSGVVKPDLYDPKLNRSYAELAAHYGFLIDPAR